MNISAENLLTQIKSTGTKYGSSYHERLLTCVKKEYYYQTLNAAVEVDAEPNEDMLRGSIYHHLQRTWREGNLLEVSIPDTDIVTIELKALRLACRQFGAYRNRFPDGLWPTVAVEEPLGVSEEEQQKLGMLLPHVKATAQIDLRTEISDNLAPIISEKIGQYILPGRYLVDYKTGGYFDTQKLEKLRLRLQGRLYMVLYNILRPEAPIQGIIYDCISEHADKTPKYPKGVGPQSYFAIKYFEPTDEAFIKELWSDLAVNQALLDAGDLRANKSACFSGFGVCPYLNKPCDQMHSKVEISK